MSNPDIQPRPISPDETVLVVPPTVGPIGTIGRLLKAIRGLHQREKTRIRHEIAQVPGLMVLLMKPRNGSRWTRAEREELRGQLRRLSRLSLYLATAALPFTTLTLPLVAWWLDRRQRRRDDAFPGDTR